MNPFYAYLKHKLQIPKSTAGFFDEYAKQMIQKNRPLWDRLQDYLHKSSSVGCSYSDYLMLYNYVKRKKPLAILECGTGVTTIVLAHALEENEAQYGIKGRVVSMEESEQYHVLASRLLPEDLKSYTDIILSPVVEDTYEFFRGVRYRDTPLHHYDFVFIDGPNYLVDATYNIRTFDFDLMKVLMSAEKPVDAMIDGRTSTCLVYSILLKDGKLHYDYTIGTGIIKSCTKADLLSTKEIVKRVKEKQILKSVPLFSSIRGWYW